MRLVYNFFIFLYGLVVKLASLFNVKAQQWVDGRKGLFGKVEEALSGIDRKENPVIWFHASSLGEFEQGRPIIEAFREAFPGYKILLTFFSPSGYEVRKSYDKADWIFYLPLDTPENARRWVELVQPVASIFIKYDFWFNYMENLHKKNIPIYFISSLFRPGQHFFQWYGGWFRKQLMLVTHFFVQNKSSEALLNTIGLNNATVTGDTRFDRVFSIASSKHSFPLIEQFINGHKVFVGGSTWKEDEAILAPLIKHKELNLKFILAPHNTSTERVQHIITLLDQPVVRYSALTAENANQADVLIIDSVGILAQLYQYATLAYIGGGFGGGLHNIQEPITYGVPVFFGPGYHKFREAVDLVGQGGVVSVKTTDELFSHIDRILADPDKYQHMSTLCRNYVDENRGATTKIMQYLFPVFQQHGHTDQRQMNYSVRQ